MLQNFMFTANIVSGLFKQNQQERYKYPPPPDSGYCPDSDVEKIRKIFDVFGCIKNLGFFCNKNYQ